MTQAEVTLVIGDGSSLPGSNENPIEVRLDNPNDKVRGIYADICDLDNYLICTGCETTDRTPFFRCSTNERDNGCCSVMLISDSGDLIQKGTGAVLTLKHDVSGEAPAGECRDLHLENVKVADEWDYPLIAHSTDPSKFCFWVCGDIYPDETSSESNDCGDGEVDIFDVLEGIDIVLGIGVHSGCQWTRADLPTGTPPNCLDPDGIIDIFDILVIIDVVLNRKNCCNYYYDMIKCMTNEACDDGFYCNGVEICVDGECQNGEPPCTDDGLYCNGMEGCDEVNGVCTQSGNSCPGQSCSEDQGCYTPEPEPEPDPGPGPSPPPSECDSDDDCDDDGLYCNGDAVCSGGSCRSEGNPCPDDDLFCNGEESCSEEKDKCIHGGDPCEPDLVCDEENDACVDCLNDNGCNDGLYCNGVESCVDNVCQAGSDLCQDDGLFCNGDESCDEENDECISSGDPCSDPTPICNEEDDVCKPEPPVPAPIITLIPDSALRSHLILLPLFMFIVSDYDVKFDRTVTVSFDGDAITPLWTLVISEHLIFTVSLVIPAGLGAENTVVEVIVTKTSTLEEVRGVLTLTMLPWILEE